MGTYRKRFNEKAKTGMLAKHEKLRRARQKRFLQQPDGTEKNELENEIQKEEEFDPNAEILLPMTESEKLEHKKKLQEQLRKPEESSMSRKKRKRLEKYIVSAA